MTLPAPTLQRSIAALLGFLLKGEVDAIFKQQPFHPARENVSPQELWREGLEARRGLAPVPNAAETVALPVGVADQVSAIRARSTFAEFYQAVADYQIVLAPIEPLLAPQWYADMDYVEELAQRVPALDDLPGLLDYSFAEGEIAEPVVTNNQVVFSSHRRDLFCSPIPTVRKLAAGEYEIVARALSRPNYVHVARLGTRLLLTNGVHKVLAAWRAGVTHIPCAVREIGDLSEAGLNAQGTTLFIDATFKGPRPALVVDFLDRSLVAELKLRAMDQVLRVVLGVEPPFQAPALL